MSNLVISAVIIAIRNTSNYEQYKEYLEILGYGDYASKEYYEEGLKEIRLKNYEREVEKTL